MGKLTIWFDRIISFRDIEIKHVTHISNMDIKEYLFEISAQNKQLIYASSESFPKTADRGEGGPLWLRIRNKPLKIKVLRFFETSQFVCYRLNYQENLFGFTINIFLRGENWL